MPKRNENIYPQTDTNVYSSIIHKNQMVETAQCPSMDEWINKLWYIHTMKYSSTIKMNEVLKHATTWMNLEKKHAM